MLGRPLSLEFTFAFVSLSTWAAIGHPMPRDLCPAIKKRHLYFWADEFVRCRRVRVLAPLPIRRS